MDTLNRAGDVLGALVCAVEALDDGTLRHLAARGRTLPTPPAFSGRCLDADYLRAVAAGQWSPDDEARLEHALTQAEVAALSRVERRHRRGLRTALRATAVSAATQHLPRQWQPRRAALSEAWEAAVGPVPRP